ncbi:unnamed protein product, partial [Linum tenue]
ICNFASQHQPPPSSSRVKFHSIARSLGPSRRRRRRSTKEPSHFPPPTSTHLLSLLVAIRGVAVRSLLSFASFHSVPTRPMKPPPSTPSRRRPPPISSTTTRDQLVSISSPSVPRDDPGSLRSKDDPASRLVALRSSTSTVGNSYKSQKYGREQQLVYNAIMVDEAERCEHVSGHEGTSTSNVGGSDVFGSRSGTNQGGGSNASFVSLDPNE